MKIPPTTTLFFGSAFLLLSACAPMPQYAPYRTVAQDCGGRNLPPDVYRECANTVEVGNSIRADMRARYRAEESAAGPVPWTPTYQPTYTVPATLPAPSVYVAPTPVWSGTTDYVPHVQPAPQYVPVVPGPATGAGGWGLNPQ